MICFTHNTRHFLSFQKILEFFFGLCFTTQNKFCIFVIIYHFSKGFNLRCTVLQHLSFEDLGFFKQVLINRKHALSFINAGIDSIKPSELIDVDLLILLGSPLSVNQTNDFPWLDEIINCVKTRLNYKKPTLGICFGAQLIALCMGSKIFPNKIKEIGWSKLSLSSFGEKSCLSELNNRNVLHWHGDTFDLPKNGVNLASTEFTLNQAFSINDFALGLQFHCEVSGTKIERWLIGHSYELLSSETNIPELRQVSNRIGDSNAYAATLMLERWLDKLDL